MHVLRRRGFGRLLVDDRAVGLDEIDVASLRGRTALEVLNVSSGRSFVSETLVPERVLTGAFPNTFRLALLQKDAGIAAQLLRDTGVEGPILELAYRLYGEARRTLGEHDLDGVGHGSVLSTKSLRR